MEIHRDRVVHKVLAWNKTFSLTVTNHQPRQANKQHSSLEVATHAGLWKFKAMPDNVLENCYLTTWFSLPSGPYAEILKGDSSLT